MTYLPTTTVAAAVALSATDRLSITQSGLPKQTTLGALKTFVTGVSAELATVTDTTGRIVNSVGKIYTLQPLAGQGYQIYINGVADPATHDVVALVMHDGNCWQGNSLGQWYAYINDVSIGQAGDPRLLGPQTETLTVTTPGPQVAGVAFTLSGTCRYSTVMLTALDFSLNNGASWIAATSPTITGNAAATAYSFSVTIAAANAAQVIKVRNHTAQSVIGTSGPFAVTSTATSGTQGPYTYPAGASGPYGGIGDTGAGAGAQAYLYGRSLGDLFGTYTYPNPGGLDGGKTLKQNLDKLFSVAGVRPKTMNAFNDNQNDLNRIGAGTFAYGWGGDVDAATVSGPNGYLRPIIGVKLGSGTQGWDDPATYDAIVAGTYDSQYLTEVNAWISQGYKKLTYRYAYEFNGTFMPDYCGHNVTDNQRFAAAMRHVILLVKNRCIQAGVNARFSWNPTSINYGDTDIINAYPGDDVIDIIDTDIYNHVYPLDLANWDANGNFLNTTAADGVAWNANVNNRRKYWNYPGCKRDAPTSSGGWSVLRAIALAKAKGKPIAFSECGTGSKGTDTSVALLNSPDWVIWFWQTLQSAISQGVTIEHINLWNIYAGDGQWEYSAPDSYDPQPLVTLAYRKYFGDGLFAGGPAPISGGVTPAPTPTPTPTPGSGPATIAITGTNGVNFTFSATLADFNNRRNLYTPETGLGTNIYLFPDSNVPGLLKVGPDTASSVSAVVVTKNGLNIEAYGFPSITYN
jgi:hypothetical protein